MTGVRTYFVDTAYSPYSSMLSRTSEFSFVLSVLKGLTDGCKREPLQRERKKIVIFLHRYLFFFFIMSPHKKKKKKAKTKTKKNKKRTALAALFLTQHILVMALSLSKCRNDAVRLSNTDGLLHHLEKFRVERNNGMP